MSELKGAHIAAMVAGDEANGKEPGTIESWVADALDRSPDEIVQEKLRIPLRIRHALDRASSLTGRSKNALMSEFIIDGLRRLKTAESAARTSRDRKSAK